MDRDKGVDIDEIEAVLDGTPDDLVDLPDDDDEPDEPLDASVPLPGLDQVRVATPPAIADTGFPNPHNLELTACHLPPQLVADRKALLRFIGSHVAKNKVAKFSPSPNEQKLYSKYVGLTRRQQQKPVLPRSFCAAVRCIVAGKHPNPPAEAALETFAL